MEQKYRWLLICRNLKAKQKLWVKNVFLMIVACILILFTGGVTKSIDQLLTNYLLGEPSLRNLQIDVEKENADSLFQELVELKDKDEHIQDVFLQNLGRGCEVTNLKKYERMGFDTSDTQYGIVITETDKYLDDRYLSDGRWIKEGEHNVGLLPKYFSMNARGDMQDWNSKLTYVDGERLIGETVSLHYYTYRVEGNEYKRDRAFPYEFKVIGTYDNLKAGKDSCFVILPYDDIKEMTDVVERYSEEPTESISTIYNVMVDKVENVGSVEKELTEIAKSFERSGVLREGTAGSLELFKNLLYQIGKIAGITLFMVEGIILSVAFYQQIKDRTKEIGVYKAVGYENKHILSIIFGEILVMGALTFAISVAISWLMLMCVSLIIKWKATLLLTKIHFTMCGSDVLLCVALCGGVLLFGSLAGIIITFRMEPKKALASKGE